MKAPNKNKTKMSCFLLITPTLSRLHWSFVTLSEQEHQCDDENCCKAHYLVAIISIELVCFFFSTQILLGKNSQQNQWNYPANHLGRLDGRFSRWILSINSSPFWNKKKSKHFVWFCVGHRHLAREGQKLGKCPNYNKKFSQVFIQNLHTYVPWSKVAILGMVIPPLIGILIIGI